MAPEATYERAHGELWSRGSSPGISISAGCMVALLNAALSANSPEEALRAHLGLGYGLQTALFLLIAMQRHRWATIRLLQPSLLALCYIGGSIALGGWAFSTGNVVRESELRTYYSWANVRDIYLLVSAALFALFLVSLRSGSLERLIGRGSSTGGVRESSAPTTTIVVAVMIALYGLAVFAPPGYLSQVKTVVFAAIVYVVFQDRSRLRWPVAVGLIIFAAAVSFHNKREVIFSIIPLGIAALALNPTRMTRLQDFAIAIFGIASVIILIVAMSIMRGYGSYFVDDFWGALERVPDYIRSSRVLAVLGLNFETTYLFLHLHNAAAAVLSDGELLTWGSTYAKALLLGPVGEFLGYQPDSIIQTYTSHIDPAFRAVGGSFGITSVGEAIWNFGWYAPAPLVFIYFAFDETFYFLVRLIRQRAITLSIVGLSVQQFALYYGRGSGLDIFVAYGVFAVLIAVPLAFGLRALTTSSRIDAQ